MTRIKRNLNIVALSFVAFMPRLTYAQAYGESTFNSQVYGDPILTVGPIQIPIPNSLPQAGSSILIVLAAITLTFCFFEFLKYFKKRKNKFLIKKI